MWADEGFSGLEPNLTPEFIPEVHAVEEEANSHKLFSGLIHVRWHVCAPSTPPKGNSNAVKELKNDATPYEKPAQLELREWRNSLQYG